MIWIRADANKEIGTGHVMRCLSIATELKAGGQQVCFLVADEAAVPLLEAKEQDYIGDKEEGEVQYSHTGEVELLEPDIEYLWCFKKDEFAPHYTVVPVKDIMDKGETVKSKYQYQRMVKTYNSFIDKNLIVKD